MEITCYKQLKSNENHNDEPLLSSKKLALNLIKNIKLSGKLKKTSYIYKLARFNKLKEIDAEYAKEFADLIDVVTTKLNKIYGDNWDYHLLPIFDNYKFKGFVLYFILLFDDLSITNSANEHHSFKDTVVLFEIRYNKYDNSIVLGEMMGGRLSLTLEEYHSGWLHSHLGPSKNINHLYVKQFCLGSSEIYNLKESLTLKFDENIFELLLLTIQNYLEWESLEGVPHIKMRRILGESGNRRRSTFNTDIAKQVYNELLSNIYNNFNDVFSKLNYRISNFNIIINDDDNLIKIIKELILSYINELGNNTPQQVLDAFYIKNNSYYYSPTINSIANQLENNVYIDDELIFNSKIKKLKVILPVKEKEIDIKEVLKPYNIRKELVDYVLQKFTEQLYKQYNK